MGGTEFSLGFSVVLNKSLDLLGVVHLIVMYCEFNL